jgi:hypothetical protein
VELEHPKIKAVDYESMKGKLRLEVYYESIKREPKIRGVKKCRCDERLQTKTKEFTRLPYTGLVWELVTGTPKDRDEVNKREVCECDG